MIPQEVGSMSKGDNLQRSFFRSGGDYEVESEPDSGPSLMTLTLRNMYRFELSTKTERIVAEESVLHRFL